MRITELLRLVWMNISQNKFKSIMTSIGIVVGAATIVLVFGIGRGGQMDIADQFAELNAGAIDVSYDYEGEEETSGNGGFSFGNISEFFGSIGNMFGGSRGGGTDMASMMSGDMSSGRSGGMSGRSSGNGDSSSEGGSGSSTRSMPGGDSSAGGFTMPGGDSSTGEFTMPGGDSSTGRSAMGGDSGTGEFTMPDGDSSTGKSARTGGDSSTGEFTMPDGSDFSAENMPGRGNSDTESASDNGNSAGETLDNETSADAEGDAEADTERDVEKDSDEESIDAEKDLSSESTEESEEEETSIIDERLNQEQVILTAEDVEDIERFVSGISGATISYSTRASVEGANLTSAQTYTIAGVKDSYETVSKLIMADGYFITETDEDAKARVCVLGSSVVEELFDSVDDAVGSTVYIDDRTYTIIGVLKQTSTVSSGISPDTTIFVPYATGIKYITGENIDPVLTVIAENVDMLDSVIEGVETVLEENYANTRFTFEDSGSKMQAAESSNTILTMLLTAMAIIVFVIGGIGIMNVLFVSVKERTNEIGILKAIGTMRRTILAEFLLESAAISFIGGVLGVAISFGIIPVVEHYDVRVEVTAAACLAALGFAVLTGTIFGFYPAWQASRMEPVDALNAE